MGNLGGWGGGDNGGALKALVTTHAPWGSGGHCARLGHGSMLLCGPINDAYSWTLKPCTYMCLQLPSSHHLGAPLPHLASPLPASSSSSLHHIAGSRCLIQKKKDGTMVVEAAMPGSRASRVLADPSLA